jgi:hypothetical protein
MHVARGRHDVGHRAQVAGEQLQHDAERCVGFQRRPSRAEDEDAAIAGVRGESGQHRRLPDPGGALHDQGVRLGGGHPVGECTRTRQLDVALEDRPVPHGSHCRGAGAHQGLSAAKIRVRP